MEIVNTILDANSKVSRISNKLVMQTERSYLFLDTNIFIWLYRVNEMARNELFKWFEELKNDDVIKVPSWSIHEYNVHLEQKRDEVFFPLRKLSKSITGNLNQLENYALLIGSDDLVKDSSFTDRHELINKTNKSVQEISEILKCLSKIKEKNYINVRTEIEDFFSGIIIDSDIYELQEKAKHEASCRFKNRIAPGFLDFNKEENNYGDLIIWKEILNYCKQNDAKNAFFLTLDNKTDWISFPEKIILNELNEPINYNPKYHSRYFMTKPSLVKEFKEIVGKDASFEIINIELLTEALEKISWELHDHDRYKNLTSAVNVYWQNTPTSKMIKWFLENKDIRHEALSGVCMWNESPGEVDINEFKRWSMLKDIPKAGIEKVNWTEVFISFGI